ncbi:uncharacterized protein LOC132204758 isoform X2 [Neocloeon triangulifer]|uniref:uncharacterized protein LOC132204758 isoform X2 n=1 Tax=Neocloeon triangulifer TaxID=2078957 RepID=UPI00286F1A5F|nr:uncharacterized protein LOC132204758 isoform X2 [Neocloeon triangulifer]
MTVPGRQVVLRGGSPWGFRMHGGADSGQPLRISRVNPGSKAADESIREGEIITSINGHSTQGLPNSEAHSLMRANGDTLTLTLSPDPSKRRLHNLAGTKSSSSAEQTEKQIVKSEDLESKEIAIESSQAVQQQQASASKSKNQPAASHESSKSSSHRVGGRQKRTRRLRARKLAQLVGTQVLSSDTGLLSEPRWECVDEEEIAPLPAAVHAYPLVYAEAIVVSEERSQDQLDEEIKRLFEIHVASKMKMLKRKAETFPPSLRRLDVIREDEESGNAEQNIYEDVDLRGTQESLLSSDGESDAGRSDLDEATLEFDKIMNLEEQNYEPYHSSSSDVDADFAACDELASAIVRRRSREIIEAAKLKNNDDYETVLVTSSTDLVVREVKVEGEEFEAICSREDLEGNVDAEFEEICKQNDERVNSVVESKVEIGLSNSHELKVLKIESSINSNEEENSACKDEKEIVEAVIQEAEQNCDIEVNPRFSQVLEDFSKSKPLPIKTEPPDRKTKLEIAKFDFLKTPLEERNSVVVVECSDKTMDTINENFDQLEREICKESEQLENMAVRSAEIIDKFSAKLDEMNELMNETSGPVIMEQINLFAEQLIADDKSLFETNKDKLVSFIKNGMGDSRSSVQDVPDLLKLLEKDERPEEEDLMFEEEKTLTSLEQVTQRLAEVLQNSLRKSPAEQEADFDCSDSENKSAGPISSLSSAALSTPISPARSRSASIDSNASQGTTIYVASTCSSVCSSGWNVQAAVPRLRTLCVAAVSKLARGRELMLAWGLASAAELKIRPAPNLARTPPPPPSRWYPTGVGPFAVGLSPAQQRAEPQLTRERAALLLDLHCKFAQRRAYHEPHKRMGVDQHSDEQSEEALKAKMLSEWLDDEVKIDESHTQSVLTTARKFEVERYKQGYHISKQRDIAVEIQGQRQFRMLREQMEQQMLEEERRRDEQEQQFQEERLDEPDEQQMAPLGAAASPDQVDDGTLQQLALLEEFASIATARLVAARSEAADGHTDFPDTMIPLEQGNNNATSTTTKTSTTTVVPSPTFKAKAPSPGVWSPKPGRAASSNPVLPNNNSLPSPTSSNNDEPPPPPVWTPKASPTLERKEFRPVRFETNNPPPRPPAYQEPVTPPFDLVPAQSREQATHNISSSLDRKLTLNLPKLPRAQNPTVTLLQKAREGQIPRGAIYLDHKMSANETHHQQQQRQETQQQQHQDAETVNPNDILYTVQKEEVEDNKKIVQLSPKKYDGIGPTTKEGIPLVMRSNIKEENYGKWYKRMYDSLHKAGKDDDSITIRYRPSSNSRRGYPYSSAGGYVSEPEPTGEYDSDATTGYSSKYATLDRRRIKNKEPDFTSTMPRARYISPSIKHACEVYKNQPGRIEDYEPGRSSISEKEAKLQTGMQASAQSKKLHVSSLSHAAESQSTVKKQFMAHALKDGYDSDSQLIFKKRDDGELSSALSPVEQKQAYKSIQSGGEVPLHGLRKLAPEKPREPDVLQSFFEEFERDKESPHKFVDCGDVTIHYRSPVRGLARDAPLSEEELARRQEEAMRRIYQEERRRKYLQELQDIESRRHTDNFTPSQKSPIPLNRYDNFFDDIPSRRDRTPEPKTVARALYNFVGQTPRELTFRRGDIILVRRQIDRNWYEGEHNASIGLFPFNYVEIIPYDGVRTTPKGPSEGKARAKFNFVAQSSLELSLVKGEMVVLTRRVDDNWYEGRIGLRRGIFPCTYVEVINEPGERLDAQKPMPKLSGTYMNGSSAPHSVPSSRYLPYMNQTLHIDTRSDPMPYRALYNYKPQNEDELELREGDTVFVMEKCDDGWYVGTSNRTGHFGTFPGNYVERI